MREVARRTADAAANIENPALLRKCKPLSLIAGGGQAAGMEMLMVASVSGVIFCGSCPISQCGVDPRKHTRSRPMRLNIRRPFSHDVLSRSIERTLSGRSEREHGYRPSTIANLRIAQFARPLL